MPSFHHRSQASKTPSLCYAHNKSCTFLHVPGWHTSITPASDSLLLPTPYREIRIQPEQAVCCLFAHYMPSIRHTNCAYLRTCLNAVHGTCCNHPVVEDIPLLYPALRPVNLDCDHFYYYVSEYLHNSCKTTLHRPAIRVWLFRKNIISRFAT